MTKVAKVTNMTQVAKVTTVTQVTKVTTVTQVTEVEKICGKYCIPIFVDSEVKNIRS